jgi:leader peptidase (prepilin peptidase)/N-methyltransferase
MTLNAPELRRCRPLSENHRTVTNTMRLEACLRPNMGLLLGGTAIIAALSLASLPWLEATASIILGALMLAGADIDGRTFLLPDTVTFGTMGCGLLAAPLLDPHNPWFACEAAVARAAATAGILALVRLGYSAARGREGLGFGDVKLAAGIGAWLPLEAIPVCFGLATLGALAGVLLNRMRGQQIDGVTKLPLGAYLCPALWLVFYAGMLAA